MKDKILEISKIKASSKDGKMSILDYSSWAGTLADIYLFRSNHKENIAKKDFMKFCDLVLQLNDIIKKVNER